MEVTDWELIVQYIAHAHEFVGVIALVCAWIFTAFLPVTYFQ